MIRQDSITGKMIGNSYQKCNKNIRQFFLCIPDTTFSLEKTEIYERISIIWLITKLHKKFKNPILS